MKYSVLAAATLFLASCGGGSSGDDPVAQNDPVIANPTPDPVAGECIDTPPVGDGIGWNGVEACTVAGFIPDSDPTPTPTPTPGDCVDTPPVGDGFGWNGVTSCTLAVTTPEPEPTPTPDPTPVAGECVDTPPLDDGFGWNGVASCALAVVTPPEPEPTPTDPDHVVKINFEGIEAFVLDFSFSQFGRLQVNALFVNNTSRPLDAQCRIELIDGFTEVGSSFISIDDLEGGDTVPDQTTFLTDGLNRDSFDRVRLSGCFTTTPRPAVQVTPEPGFEYVIRSGFEGVEAFVLGYTFDQFGNFQVNGLFRNNSNGTVDAQCRLTLINGLKVVDYSFLSVDDIANGESVPDSTRFLVDGINQNSFDRIRLSGCFTL